MTASTRVRPLGPGDEPLIEHAFVLTADWNPVAARGEDFWRADPTFTAYTGGWGRAGDGGVVAEEAGRAVGVVWWRLFPIDGPGYGFVDEHTPEIGIAVWPDARGRGLGRMLLRAALARHPRLSLNVEDGNRAQALYASEGFTPVGRSGDGTVMLHP